MGRYVECPAPFEPELGSAPSVFLAGGITGVVDWQHDAVQALCGLDVVVLNPRRTSFPIGDPAAAPEQITWEHRALRLADLTLFWFPPSDPAVTTQPIALLELGAALDDPTRRIVVGASPAYPRVLDVRWQARLSRPHLTVHDSLTDTVAAARALLDR